MSLQIVLERETDSGKHNPEEIIEEFFAVTTTSVHRVSSQKDTEGTPIVEKIALIIGESLIPVGGRLYGGKLVGIMKSGIVLYIEDYSPFSRPSKRRQRPEQVNIAFWGGQTSPVVALCLKRDDALACAYSKELKHCDPRWRQETEKTLKHIGDDHPVFILSVTEPIRFD